MQNNQPAIGLGQTQRVLLVLVAFCLSASLLFLKNGINSRQPLDQLARRSLPPEVALANGKPTIFEFYADWCEVCQQMAPTMLELEKTIDGQINVVLLNVDNEMWSYLIDRYEVNGIPQFNFFNRAGELEGKSIGFMSLQKIMYLSQSLIENNYFSDKDNFNFSPMEKSNFTELNIQTSQKVVNPMSHG